MRPAAPPDAGPMAALFNRDRNNPLSAEEFFAVRHPVASWIIEAPDGQIAGWADLRAPTGSAPEDLWVHVAVDDAHSRHGVGSRLLETAEQHASAIGAWRLLAGVGEERPDAVAWALHRQYHITQRYCESVLDVSATPWALWDVVASSLAGRGAQVLSLAHFDEPELSDRLLSLLREAEADMPDPPARPASAEEWRARLFEGPRAWPETGVVITGPDGHLWAISAHNRLGERARQVEVILTAVARSRRGQGLGLAVKLAGLRKLRHAGIARVTTSTHVANHAMRAVNRRLGFRDLPASLILEKDLAAHEPKAGPPH